MWWFSEYVITWTKMCVLTHKLLGWDCVSQSVQCFSRSLVVTRHKTYRTVTPQRDGTLTQLDNLNKKNIKERLSYYVHSLWRFWLTTISNTMLNLLNLHYIFTFVWIWCRWQSDNMLTRDLMFLIMWLRVCWSPAYSNLIHL